MSVRERIIAALLVLALGASVAFIAVYVTTAARLYEGLSLSVAAAALSAAGLGWAFWILPHEQVVDERDDVPSSEGDRVRETTEVRTVFDEITRRATLIRLLYAAIGTFAVALIVPVRSLGRGTIDALFHTKWRPGLRLVREDGRPVRRGDLNVDSIVTVFPENAPGDAQSQAVLIRLPPGGAKAADGYIAYSKVCTHAGCAIALYRAQAKQLLCPCHQSVFDVTANGAVVSGPADRALPRLPIAFDRDGYAVAQGDFPEPVGPGFWQRD